MFNSVNILNVKWRTCNLYDTYLIAIRCKIDINKEIIHLKATVIALPKKITT